MTRSLVFSFVALLGLCALAVAQKPKIVAKKPATSSGSRSRAMSCRLVSRICTKLHPKAYPIERTGSTGWNSMRAGSFVLKMIDGKPHVYRAAYKKAPFPPVMPDLNKLLHIN